MFPLGKASLAGPLGVTQVRAAASALLLDTVPGATAAYSLRKLRAAYAGSAARIRRSSDNDEQDIGFVGNDFDATSFSAFIGAGSGYAVTWHDQSGNGLDVTQPIALLQPQIVLNAQGALPGIYFDGAGDYLVTTSFPTGLTEAEIFTVARHDADPPAGDIGYYGFQSAATFASHVPWQDGTIYDAFGSTDRKSTVDPASSMASTFLYSVYSAANDWANYLNGTQLYQTGTNTVAFDATATIGVNIGGFGLGVYKFKGYKFEYVILDHKATSGDRATVWADQNTFYSIF